MSHPYPVHHRYEIRELLGKGGMGLVYRAWDRHEKQTVALKTLRTSTPGDRRRFEEEIRTLAKLRHDGIAQLHDLGELGDDLYFTMEYYPGVTLDAWLDQDLPPHEEISWLVRVALRVTEALGYIHRRGVLHGDLKPSNVMVLPVHGNDAGSPRLSDFIEDREPRVKVLDFGVAQNRWHAAEMERPPEGTPLYMAPEQLEGLPTGERSDLYSIGALLYHLLTRSPPCRSLVEVISARVRPRPPHVLNPACGRDLSDLVIELLSRESRGRPPTADVVSARLRSIAGEPTSDARAVEPCLLSPVFTGYRAELDRIRAALAQAAGGEGQLLRIAGEQGSGKSWLLSRSGLKSEVLLDHQAAYLRGRFSPDLLEVQGLSEVFRGILNIPGHANPGHGVAPSGLGPWGDSFLEVLALDHGGDGGPRGDRAGRSPAADRLPPAVLREQFLDTALRLIREAARLKPLVIILEDLQHAGELEGELLSRLSRRLETLPILLIVTYRPDAIQETSRIGRWLEGIGESDSRATLRLEGFPDGEIAAFIRALLSPPAEVSRQLLDYLREQTGGNPLALARWLQFLWRRRAIALEDGKWKLDSVPRDSSSATQWKERLADLEPTAMEVLVAASILGSHFDAGWLSLLMGEREGEGGGERNAVTPERDSLRPALRTLVRSGFLVETPGGCTIAPDFDPQHLGPWLSPRRSRALHLRAAEILLERNSPGAAAHPGRIAMHYSRAGERRAAARYFREAGGRAARTHAHRQGIEAFRQALEHEDRSAERARIGCELGDLHARLREYDEALAGFELAEKVELSESSSGVPFERRAVLWDKIGWALQQQGKLEKAQEYFERWAREAGEPGRDGSPEWLARACLRLGGIHFDRGDLELARRQFTKSLELYGPDTLPANLIPVYSGLGYVDKLENHPAAAVEWLEKALTAAEKAGNLLETATVLSNLGNLRRARGETEQAVNCLRKSIETRERAGDRQGLAICLNNMAQIQRQRGEFAPAQEATERALEVFEETGDSKGILISRCNLGEFLLRRGKPRQARAILEANLNLAEGLEATRLLETTLCHLARVQLALGETERAEELLRRCLRSLPLDKLQPLRSEALMLLAEALIELSRLEGAQDCLREIFDLHSDGSDPEKRAELFSVEIRLHRTKGELTEAMEAGNRFLEERGVGVDRYGISCLHRELGKVFRDLGPDWADRTEKHLDRALEEFELMGCPLEVAETLIHLGHYWNYLGERDRALDLWQRSEAFFVEAGLGHRLSELGRLQNQT